MKDFLINRIDNLEQILKGKRTELNHSSLSTEDYKKLRIDVVILEFQLYELQLVYNVYTKFNG
jgi:hypothetical protein